MKSNQYIINPGSVGLQAYDDVHPSYHKIESGTNKASYCIITREDHDYSVDRILVSYDWKSAYELAMKNNHKNWANWIRTGRV